MDNFELSVTDLERCGIIGFLESTKPGRYHEIFSWASKQAELLAEDGEVGKAEVLALLAQLCLLAFNTVDRHAPFYPGVSWGARSSASLSDFAPHADFIRRAASSMLLPPGVLKARLCDVSSLLTRKNHEHAIGALRLYADLELTKYWWFRDRKEIFNRAGQISLSMMRSHPAEGRKLVEKLLAFFATENPLNESGHVVEQVAEQLLMLVGFLHAGEVDSVLQKLMAAAKDLHAAGAFVQERDYLELSVRYVRKRQTSGAFAELASLLAISNMAEAEWHSETTGNWMQAAQNTERAIQRLREIPHKERGRMKFDERLKTAILLQEKYLRLSGASLSRHLLGAVPGPEVAAMAASSVDAVIGRDVLDSMVTLGRFFGSVDLAKEVQRARKVDSMSVIRSAVSTMSLRSHGRLAASDLQGVNKLYKEYEPTLIKQYCREAGLRVVGCIFPALEQIVSEHEIDEKVIYRLLARSSTVPPDSRDLVAKGLLAGFRQDFAVALHLLGPQMENLVRYHLKNANVVTRSVLKTGATTENGLSSLMELQEAVQVFGDGLAFEIRAVFCDSLGPNYRNEIAHGLVSYEECESPMSVYAWWLFLRVACLIFANPLQSMPV